MSLDQDFAPRPHRAPPSRKDTTRGLDGRIYPKDVEESLNLLAAKVLGTPDGTRLMNYLRSITLNVAFEADVSPNALMHREGQRWLVGLLVQRLQKGNER